MSFENLMAAGENVEVGEGDLEEPQDGLPILLACGHAMNLMGLWPFLPKVITFVILLLGEFLCVI